MRAALAFGIAASVALAACGASAAVSLAPELGVSARVSPAQALRTPWPAPLSVPLLSGGTRTLRSCTDFLGVSKQVSDAIDSRDEQVLLGQAVRCEALKAVVGGRPAARSFVAGWKLDAAGWRTAPPAFDFQFSPDGADQVRKITAKGGSAADLEKVSITPKDALHDFVRGDGWTGDFAVLVRGLDVTGDGDEDLIVSRNVAATEGTLRAMTYFVVTRTGPKGPLRVVRSFP